MSFKMGGTKVGAVEKTNQEFKRMGYMDGMPKPKKPASMHKPRMGMKKPGGRKA